MNQELTDQVFIIFSVIICFKTDETDKQRNPRDGTTNNAKPIPQLVIVRSVRRTWPSISSTITTTLH